MSLPSPNLLEGLPCPDEPSSEFHDKLSSVLRGEEYRQWAQTVEGGELIGLLDYLEKAFDLLNPASSCSKRCLGELVRMCGTTKKLPTSCTISPQVLTVGSQPVTSGSSGDVYEGSLDGTSVRVKIVRESSKDDPQEAIRTLFQDAIVWKRLRHKNIVSLLGIAMDPLQLISEWMPSGNLTDYVEKHPDANKHDLLCDVAEGLQFLHSHDIVHGDLNESILVDGSGHARIADFGLAAITQSPDPIRRGSEGQGIATQWIAPEIVNKRGAYSKQADVFAFAAVMIAVFTGAVPSKRSPPRPTHPGFTNNLWSLVRRCWNQDPCARPEAWEIFETLRKSDPSKPYTSRFALFSTQILRPRSPFTVHQDTMAGRPSPSPSLIHNVALSTSLPSPPISFWPAVRSSPPTPSFYYPGGARKSRSNSHNSTVDRNMLWKDMNRSPPMVTVPKRSRTLSEAAKRVKIRRFINVVSQALPNIVADEETQSSLLTMMIAIKLEGRSTGIEGADAPVETLVETLDQLVRKIQDKKVLDDCLSILSKVCRDKVILPKSCVVSNVALGERWKIGGVSDIFTGKHEQTDVCIKVFRQHEDIVEARIKAMFYQHVVRWRYISHKNVLPFLGVSEVVPPFGIVSPRMPNKNILEYTRKHLDANRLGLLTDTLCGLEYLHSLDIVHGSVNPGNILVNEQGAACVGDFQIATIITDPEVKVQCQTTVCRRGIVRYMAPEQVDPRGLNVDSCKPTKATDVHSFAMTAYEVLTGTEPYQGVTGEGPLAVRIINGVRPSRPKEGRKWLSNEIWDLLVSCWELRPALRPQVQCVHEEFKILLARANGSAARGEPAAIAARPQPQPQTNTKKHGIWCKVKGTLHDQDKKGVPTRPATGEDLGCRYDTWD